MSANETTDQSPSSSSEDETVAEIRRFFKKHEIVKKLPKHMKELFIVETSADRNINISETFKEQFGNRDTNEFPKMLTLRNHRFFLKSSISLIRSSEFVDSPDPFILQMSRFSEIIDSLNKSVL